jgi:RimJ/RimL family protein N-acetyltransferase
MSQVLETTRLRLSRASDADCQFLFELVNEPSFKRHIGDKGIHNLEDARAYLHEVYLAHYARHGYGLYRVSLRDEDTALGICGLVKRAAFPLPDLGFAFLKAHRARGYAYESAQAVLQEGRDRFGMKRILAMANADNERSTRLLDKLGFRFECMVRMPGESIDIRQYALDT